MSKKRGRPKLPAALKRGNRVELVLTDEERARLVLNAERAGLTVSEFVRRRALSAAGAQS